MMDDNKEGAGGPLHVGDSKFESWFASKDMKGLGTKQLARDAYAAGMSDPAVMPAEPSDAVTDAMVDAYLKANDAYWKQTDQLPSPPDKWRTGTPREATRVSLAAALSQTMQPQAGADHSQLMKFYGVDSVDALIVAQADHIEKLQDRLPRNTAFTVQRVREG